MPDGQDYPSYPPTEPGRTVHERSRLLWNRRQNAAHDEAIHFLLLDTGLRVSELCALTLADIDCDTGPKTEAGRVRIAESNRRTARKQPHAPQRRLTAAHLRNLPSERHLPYYKICELRKRVSRKEKQAMNWKIGDVVQLKSGGPAMTVTYVRSIQTEQGEIFKAQCDWFYEGTPSVGDFPVDALLAFEKPEPSKASGKTR